jgi:hypothetical protein
VAIGAILTQDSTTVQPIAYFSKKFNSAETKCKAYNLELLAILLTLEIWKHHLLVVLFLYTLIELSLISKPPSFLRDDMLTVSNVFLHFAFHIQPIWRKWQSLAVTLFSSSSLRSSTHWYTNSHFGSLHRSSPYNSDRTFRHSTTIFESMKLTTPYRILFNPGCQHAQTCHQGTTHNRISRWDIRSVSFNTMANNILV